MTACSTWAGPRVSATGRGAISRGRGGAALRYWAAVRGASILPVLLLVQAELPAAPREPEGRLAEEAMLARWDRAGPDERRGMRSRMGEVDRQRRFTDARPILVRFEETLWPLERLFAELLEPALQTPLEPEGESDPGLLPIHERALAALDVLRSAYGAPQAVTTGTLNLFVQYAGETLAAIDLSAPVRLRFFLECLRNVRAVEERASPDARTRWLVKNRLLPLLLGLAARQGDEAVPREVLSEAASLFYLPRLLDFSAQAQIAPLAEGLHARDILARAYRERTLDRGGLVALARTIALAAASDPAFATSAPPLLLELICDEQLPPEERGALLDTVLAKLAPLAPLRPLARDLLAAVRSGPPRPLEDYSPAAGPVALPRTERLHRLLQVLLLHPEPGRPPVLARVVRADVRAHVPIRAGEGFVGVLVPSEEGEGIDLLGPPPGLTGARDPRLLRRTLRQERVAISLYGARGEEIEICVSLPEDASEPVPEEGATVDHLLALVSSRLARSAEEDERRDLVRLLVRLDTAGARELAVKAAGSGSAALELLPLVDAGYAAAAAPLLGHLAALPLDRVERALAAMLRAGDAALAARVRDLCRGEAVAPAVLAADALLATGDVSGVAALLAHGDVYARAAATSLALRLTRLAGSMQIIPADRAALAATLESAGRAFDRKDGTVWTNYGAWLRLALAGDGAEVRRLRLEHTRLEIDGRVASAAEVASAWTKAILDGRDKERWAKVAYELLKPQDPGWGAPKPILEALLDALEARATEGLLAKTWRDSLVVLACVQQGMEADTHLLELARERLWRLAGPATPPGAERKPGIFWPIWAAAQR